MTSRICLIQKLAGTKWGASAHTLRTSALAIVYSAAEYCSPAWEGSTHTKRVDTALNQAMRVISGTVKSTPTVNLPVLSGIAPPEIRRRTNTAKMMWRAQKDPTSLLHGIVATEPAVPRLKSRSPFSRRAQLARCGNPPLGRAQRKRCAEEMALRLWEEQWATSDSALVRYRSPGLQLPAGADLPRLSWCRLNRLLTGHGRTAACLHRWGMRDSPSCDCGTTPQTCAHIVEDCPSRRIPGGMETVAAVTNAKEWLARLDVEV